MALPVSGLAGQNSVAAAEIIRIGSKAVLSSLGAEQTKIESLFNELKFVDDRASDYRVYFNAAGFENNDDGQDIQFIYLGYFNDKKSLCLMIGTINGDKLSMRHGSIIEVKENQFSWFKGGEFIPAITTKTSSVAGSSQAKLTVLDEQEFLRTSIDYVRSFEQVALVELNDSKAG